MIFQKTNIVQISDIEMDKEQEKEELQMEDQIGWKRKTPSLPGELSI